jgi:hypothetical protein
MKKVLVALVGICLLLATVAATDQRGGRYTMTAGHTSDAENGYAQLLYRFDSETGEVSVAHAYVVSGQEGPNVSAWVSQKRRSNSE